MPADASPSGPATSDPPGPDAPPYLAGLRLRGRRVLVVGGGGVAQRRLPALLDAGADVLLVAPEVTPTIEALAGDARIAWRRGRFGAGDLDGAWYALAATDDPAVNAEVAAAAERRRVFCVRADDVTGGTALTPAVGRYENLAVAVYGGRDPRRAVAVRDAVLDGLREGAIEAEPVRGTASGDRAAGGAPQPGVALPGAALPGVALVGGGPGDPELITVRGRRLVSRADVLVVDRLAPQGLLSLARTDAEVIDAAKLPRGRSMQQATINELLVRHALAGKFVVRLKGGDPFVFGRGAEEIEACAAAGVPVTVVPGLSSAIGVPGLVGIPVTHRELAQEFVVVSGHVPPGDPRSTVDWTAVARLRGTVVLLMAVENLQAITAALIEGGRPADTPVAVVVDGSLEGQRVVRSVLGEAGGVAASEGVRPPAIVVIGQVAAPAGRARSATA